MKPDIPIPSGRLRPATAEDLDGVVKLLHDEHVRRYLCDDVLLPREAVTAMLVRSDRLNTQGLGLWILERGREGFAGIAGLEPVSAEVGTSAGMAGGVEPIIALRPDCWGQGLASAGLAAVVRYARDTLGLLRLVAAVDQPNARSHRLLERCGFAVIGTAPGPAHDLILYELPFHERYG